MKYGAHSRGSHARILVELLMKNGPRSSVKVARFWAASFYIQFPRVIGREWRVYPSRASARVEGKEIKPESEKWKLRGAGERAGRGETFSSGSFFARHRPIPRRNLRGVRSSQCLLLAAHSNRIVATKNVRYTYASRLSGRRREQKRNEKMKYYQIEQVLDNFPGY